MQHARLGASGISVSRVCLGTATFGLQSDEQAAREILDKAAAGGINFIDTADSYPMSPSHDHGGRAEEILGRWLKGRRDDFIVEMFGVGNRAQVGVRTSVSTNFDSRRGHGTQLAERIG